MTRLIDADELCKELEEWGADLYDTSSGRQLGVTDAIVIACQMPTVEAIPVEYIESTMNRWKEIIGYDESAEALRILIDNWKIERKEE